MTVASLKLEIRDAIYLGSLLVAAGAGYGKLASMDARITDVQSDVRAIYSVLMKPVTPPVAAVRDATFVSLRHF